MILHDEIQLWLARLAEHSDLSEEDRDELESHILDRIEDLQQAGLSEEEALLIALRRMGSENELILSQTRKSADRIWKDLYSEKNNDPESDKIRRRERLMTAGIYAGLVLVSWIPAMFGAGIDGENPGYFLNLSVICLPLIALYYVSRRWIRGVRPTKQLIVPALLLLLPLLLNIFPFEQGGQTLFLSISHIPLASWLLFYPLRRGGDLHCSDGRLDFIRFSGEAVIYSVLIGSLAMVLSVLAAVMFALLQIDFASSIYNYLSAPVFPLTLFTGVLLVEKKRSLVENFAPTLARIMSVPLLLVIAVFTVMFIARSSSLDTARELLIVMDVLLLVVITTVIFSVSSEGSLQMPGRRIQLQRMLNLSLVGLATVLDVFMLVSMVYRLNEYGLSANKLTSLGSNVLLLGNLLLLLVYYLRSLRGKSGTGELLVWQGRYFTAYFIWLYAVGMLFPVIFQFS